MACHFGTEFDEGHDKLPGHLSLKYLTLKITFHASVSIGSKILLIQSCMQRLDGNFERQITPKRGPDMKKKFRSVKK